MKMTLTARHLGDISTDISRKSPLWGLLRANEYLPSESLLRKALVSKVRKIISDDPKYENLIDLCDHIFQGAKFGELNRQTQQTIKSLERGRVKGKKKVPLLMRKISHSTRKQRLDTLMKAA